MHYDLYDWINDKNYWGLDNKDIDKKFQEIKKQNSEAMLYCLDEYYVITDKPLQ